jgi:hypothetical protein
MNVSGTLSAASRRMLVASGVAVFLSVSVGASSRMAGPEAPKAPTGALKALQQQEEDQLKFTRSGRMMILWQIAPGRDQDFLLAWRTIKDNLTKMGDPAKTAFANGINILRVETPPGGEAIFLFDLDPVSTAFSYNPVTLLFETLKQDEANPDVGLTYDQANEIYQKISDIFVRITPWPVSVVR